MTKKDKPKPPVARDILNPSHLYHRVFFLWVKDNCGNEELTLRKARKFKALNPGCFVL